MDSKTGSLSQAINFIQTNPQGAAAKALTWQNFIKKNPVAASHQTIDKFLEWGQKERIDYQTLQGLWFGKEINEAYPLVKPQEQMQDLEMQNKNAGSGFTNLIMSPLVLLGLRDTTKLMEEDKNYKKIEEAKIKDWQAKNPDKDTSSKEWLDYKYGPLEDRKGPLLEEKQLPPALKEETEAAFRANKKYDGKVKKYDKEKKRAYNKIGKDQAITKTQLNIQAEAHARYEALRHKENASYQDILKKVKEKRWEEFVEKHPEKTEAYKPIHQEIKLARDRVKTKQELSKYKETTGKAIKPTEKIHREAPTLTQPEIQTRLEQAFKPAPTPAGLVLPQNWGEPKPKPKIMEDGKLQAQTKSTPAPPPAPLQKPPLIFQQTIKNPQTFHAPQGGRKSSFTSILNKGIGGAINRVNRFAAQGGTKMLTKPLSAFTNQLSGQAKSAILKVLAANPELTAIILVVVIILLFTIGIIMPLPGGVSSGSPTTTITPSISLPPGTTITPTLNTQAIQDAINLLKANSSNIAIYQQASAITGVPWQTLAGVHYVEGRFDPNSSLVSGRTIGNDEPDLDRKHACSSGASGPGIPIALPSGGCGFASLLDSAIYAGRLLISNIGHVPISLQDTVTSLSMYNGGGNANCGEGVPYSSPSNCPPLYYGEDDPYAMNLFDIKHENMYLIYCADLTKCIPPVLYQTPGAETIASAINTYY